MKRILFYLAPLCLALPALASATEGYVVSDISLQAGPDTEYPSITELAAGTPVEIQGCIDGYTWCDVIVGADRGWVAGSFIEEQYDNQPVVIVDYGPRIGIPLVTFSLGTYWGNNYHNRPWYGQRTQWEGRHIRPHQPPRPSAEAIRNVPQVHAGNMGNRDHNRPTPAVAPVATPAPSPSPSGRPAPQPRPQTRAEQQNPSAEMDRQRAQPRSAPTPVAPPPPHPVTGPKPEAPPHPVAGPKQEPPHPVAEKQAQPARNAPPVRQAPPRAQPKPKEEPKKDDGRKDDSKEH
jgi:uncharacterized protein YraI